MKADELEQRILTTVRASQEAGIVCDTVEVTIDGTIRTGCLHKGGSIHAGPSTEVEDFFEKHMGKSAKSNG